MLATLSSLEREHDNDNDDVDDDKIEMKITILLSLVLLNQRIHGWKHVTFGWWLNKLQPVKACRGV